AQLFSRTRMAGALSACLAERGLRLRAALGQSPRDHEGCRQGLRVRARGRAARTRHFAAEKASKRFLRHTADQLSDQPRCGYACCDRLHDKRVRSRQHVDKTYEESALAICTAEEEMNDDPVRHLRSLFIRQSERRLD